MPKDDEQALSDQITLPALLRIARRTYGAAIRAAQAEVGCTDMPRNGSWVVGAISRSGAPLGTIIAQLGVSKQAAGQLVDTLVVRGYLDRAPDPSDRRRMTVTLTERGQLAADAGRTAVDTVDDELKKRVGPQAVAACREALSALIDIGDEAEIESRAR